LYIVTKEYFHGKHSPTDIRDTLLDLFGDVFFVVPGLVTARYHRGKSLKSTFQGQSEPGGPGVHVAYWGPIPGLLRCEDLFGVFTVDEHCSHLCGSRTQTTYCFSPFLSSFLSLELVVFSKHLSYRRRGKIRWKKNHWGVIFSLYPLLPIPLPRLHLPLPSVFLATNAYQWVPLHLVLFYIL
jgi:hypothetical protein